MGTDLRRRVTDWRYMVAVAAVLLLAVTLVGQVRGVYGARAQERAAGAREMVTAQQAEQVDALRGRAMAAETRADNERTQQQALTCDQFDRLQRFAAAIAQLIVQSPSLPPESRALIEEYVFPQPRPPECPP